MAVYAVAIAAHRAVYLSSGRASLTLSESEYVFRVEDNGSHDYVLVYGGYLRRFHLCW